MSVSSLDYVSLVELSDLPLRLKKELKTKQVEFDFANKEFIAVFDKSRTRGLLVCKPTIFDGAVSFGVRRIQSSAGGRLKPVTCDLCVTWLPGSKAATITLRHANTRLITHTFYCCVNLECSKNVRGKTTEALESRVHLRENLTDEQRVERLESKIMHVLTIAGHIQ